MVCAEANPLEGKPPGSAPFGTFNFTAGAIPAFAVKPEAAKDGGKDEEEEPQEEEEAAPVGRQVSLPFHNSPPPIVSCS